ncbi:MAG: thioredoxin domain-containing protein [Epsilonproteobacteria bacterium]|nr:disulfide bond formation protein DsbA [Campylobacterota bacterium]NPA56539.1 thioredoxin domain-containing protein [Campylobacterota bacterium]
MSLMLRLLSVSLASGLVLSAATEKEIIKFVEKGLSNNPDLKVLDVKILEKQSLPWLEGWEAFIVQFTLKVKELGREKKVTNTDILFSKGRYVAPDLLDVKTNRSMKDRIIRSLDSSYYDERHHIFGNRDAKHKLVVFSDPLCPFCREVVPKLFKAAKEHPDLFALYYYHLPIASLHPASVPLAKAIIYLKEQGKKDLIEKIYQTDFNYEEKDEQKVLDELNKKLGLHLTKEEINRPEIVRELREDMAKARSLMIKGTPTLFFDGKYDMRREKYKKYLPKESGER